MKINPFSFSDLIAPIEPACFFSEYWDKKCLLFNNRQADGFCNLLTLKDIEYLLYTRSLTSSSPWIRFVGDKRILNPKDYSFKHRDLLNKQKVLEGYRDGNAIALLKLEERFEPIRKLCNEFESIFGHPVGTEVFLTPPNVQSFPAHYDKYNVFVLQVEGKKHWKVYDSAESFPLPDSNNPYGGQLPKSLPDLICEVDLYPGDVLYVPRGFVHEVSTTDEHSLHISLAIDVFSWLDLLMEWIKNEPEFRRALPVRSLYLDHSDIMAEEGIEIVKKCMRNPEKIELAFCKVKSRFAKLRKHPFQTNFANELHDNREISIDTILEKRSEVLYTLIREETELALCFDDAELRWSGFMEPTLRYILSSSRFSVKTMPKSLSESENIDLVKSLLKAGFLVISE